MVNELQQLLNHYCKSIPRPVRGFCRKRRRRLFTVLIKYSSGRMQLPKKDFTSFDIYAIASELKNRLIDARVNNVYQLDAKTLLLKLHKANEPPMRLVLEAGRRLHLTNYSLEKPQTPPAFCMTLRKYLPGAWITDMAQVEFERVVAFKFRTKESALKLELELFGEGNIILTDGEGQILQALFFKKMRDRNIVRGETYQFPPSSAKNPFKVTKEDLATGLKVAGNAEVVRAIVRYLGVGGLYAEELLMRAGVEKTKPCAELSEAEVESIFEALQRLLDTFTDHSLEPNIVLDASEGFVDVAPVNLKRYEGLKRQLYGSFSEALDEFYARVNAAEKAVAGIDESQVKREAERLKRMVAEQEHALQEDEAKAARDKQIGDVVYGHFNELQKLLERFTTVWREGKDLKGLAADASLAKKAGQSPEVFFESFDGRNLAINLRVDDYAFSLSLRKNLYENAAEFYDRGKMAKQKTASIHAALEDSRKKLASAQNQLAKVEALRMAAPAEAIENLATRKVETKEWFEKFRWFTTSEGFLVVGGKDAVSNEVLIKKHTDPHDLVFHVEIVGSPFVVVKTNSKEPGEQTLKEAGEFAAAYSRAWRENMGTADVYWVKPEQLSKSGLSGEFVPHGAFMVLGKRNWMRGTPLRLAIGVGEDGDTLFVGGPFDAVKTKTKVYVILMPGDIAGKELLRQILRSLTLKLPKERREKLAQTSVEAIRELVPYTKGRILQNV